VNKRRTFSTLRFLSILLILAAIVLAVLQLVRFSRVRAFLPAGLIVAGVPVGGLDRQQAAQRLMEVYSSPIELYYKDAVIHLYPSVTDFQLEIESMLSVADYQRTSKEFWEDYWDFLWGRTDFPTRIPLSATFSEARLRQYLDTIVERYDQPSEPAIPVAGTVSFQPGKPGTSLDVDTAVVLIESALNSLTSRTVNLPLERSDPTRPVFQNLEILLKQTVDVSGFDGLTGVYLMDLQTGDEIHFAYRQGEDIPVNPDIAFTASSIIKIPILVSAFSRIGENPDPETMKLVEDMIVNSGNEAADWLMDREIDETRAPLIISEEMQALGLENTFLAGYFSLGSPLLAVYETPANTRLDVNTDPDIYNQTTPSEIGMLLEDLYQCAQSGGSALNAVYPGKLMQNECQDMISFLIKNRLPVLLTAGLPEGTPIAHKHGWVSNNGVINTIGDAGIIYTPGGNYILVTFVYQPDQLVWEQASELIAQLSRAVYNFYNLPLE